MIKGIAKIIMSELRPQVILSKEYRDRFVRNVKELSAMTWNPASTTNTAAVLIPLCVVDDEVRLLYTLRSSNLNSHSGQVSFPGGKTDKGETARETALRETEEELGISRKNIDLWTEMPQIQSADHAILITPVVGFITDFDTISLEPNTNEVEEVFTVPLTHFCNPNIQGHLKFKEIPLPVYDFNNKKIWGLTAMMTHIFLLNLLPNHVYNIDSMLKRKYKLEDFNKSKI